MKTFGETSELKALHDEITKPRDFMKLTEPAPVFLISNIVL